MKAQTKATLQMLLCSLAFMLAALEHIGNFHKANRLESRGNIRNEEPFCGSDHFCFY